jgi:hypothetical protein
MQYSLEELFRNGKEGRGGWIGGCVGGAKMIPATMPGGKAMESVLGYGFHQRLGYGASHESLQCPHPYFCQNSCRLWGRLNGPPIDSGHARLQHAFWCEHMDGDFSLERGAQEYDIMLSGRARFGAVLLCIFSHCQGACC